MDHNTNQAMYPTQDQKMDRYLSMIDKINNEIDQDIFQQALTKLEGGRWGDRARNFMFDVIEEKYKDYSCSPEQFQKILDVWFKSLSAGVERQRAIADLSARRLQELNEGIG